MKKLVIFVIVVAIMLTGFYLKDNYDGMLRPINKSKFSAAEKYYLKQFYQDPSLVLTGEFFDLRYFSHGIDQYQIEIVRKYNIDLKDVMVYIVFNDGTFSNVEWHAIENTKYVEMYWCAPDYGNIYQYFNIFDHEYTVYNINNFNKDLCVYMFSLENLLSTDIADNNYTIWPKEGKIDFSNFKIQLRYKDKIETHQLVYDKDAIKKALSDYYNNLFNGNVDINQNDALNWVYYQEYTILINDEPQKRSEFKKQFWDYYIDGGMPHKEVYNFSYYLSENIDMNLITSDNHLEILKKLNEMIFWHSSYLNNGNTTEYHYTCLEIVSILEACSKYNKDINLENLDKVKSVIGANGKITSKDFWYYITLLLK